MSPVILVKTPMASPTTCCLTYRKWQSENWISLASFGGDYETKDGTGVRDYIHVVDLAVGHVLALDRLTRDPGVVTYNLGTGNGYSVLEIVAAFEKASGKTIKYEIVERRPGDIAACFADPSLAEAELGWTAKRGLDEMCTDSWRWQSKNPNGFVESPAAAASNVENN